MTPPSLLVSLLRRLGAAVLFLGALVPMLLEEGGVPLPDGALPWVRAANLLFAGILGFLEVRELHRAGYRRTRIREEIASLLLMAGTLLIALEEVVTGGAVLGLEGMEAVVAPAKAYILANLVVRVVRLFRFIGRSRWSYPKVFVGSFLVVIASGTLLLWAFPGSVNRSVDPGKTIPFADALFTSISATCVTGLTVRSTGEDFSRFGQTVILILIQIGGLGLMTFAAFFAMAVRRGIGFTDRMVLRDMLNVDPMNTLGRLLAGVVTVTFLVEGLGALAMFGNFPVSSADPTLLGTGDQLYYAVFHSVSAFCNAGFALYPDNWTPFVASPLMSGVVMAQIVLGGLGFTVILNLLGLSRALRDRVRRWLRRRPLTEEEEEEEERRERVRVSLQTKVVLGMTVALSLGGAFLLWAFERHGSMAGMDRGTGLLASLFQSVSTRTAGFNTVDIAALQPASLALMTLLMFIGASPGGTGGGIKTVTAAVLLRTVTSLARGRRRVEMARRALPAEVISQAIVVTTLGALAVFLGAMVLALTEASQESPGPAPFLAFLFEAVSAFGTVGLSAGPGGGLTAGLSDAGRVVIMVLMFVGRVGPITLVLAMGRKAPERYEFPEERVMIG